MKEAIGWILIIISMVLGLVGIILFKDVSESLSPGRRAQSDFEQFLQDSKVVSNPLGCIPAILIFVALGLGVLGIYLVGMIAR